MNEPLSSDAKSSGTPRPQSWFLRLLLWATMGAALGALWALFHYGTEGWNGPVITLALFFGLAGALGSLLGKGCGT